MSSSSHSTHSSSNVVGVHYRVGKKIGEGSFGIIYEGTNLLNNQQVAIKFEPRKSDAPQLRDEYRTYKILAGSTGIPNAFYFGQEGLHNILCIDLLGPSLEDLFDMCGRKFTIKTVVMVAKQMLSRVQTIHEKNLIYRDIKPDNFLVGKPHTKHANLVHVVDFGMAKQYRDPKTKQHIPYRERKSLSGTARYMSINTHLGRGLKAATNKQKYEKIGEKKQSTPIKELCEGFPEEFGIYLNYVRKLSFEETPDYDFLRDLFTKALKSIGEVEDGVYDWMLLNNGKGWEAELDYSSNNPLHHQSNHHHAVDARHQTSRDPNSQSQRQQQQQQQNGAKAPQQPSALVHSNSKLKHKQSTSRGAGAGPSGAAAAGGAAEQDLLRDQGYSRAAPTNGQQDGHHEGSQKKKGFWNKLVGVITCSTCFE
ncbi:casein kinase I [Entomortierella chlamydospora]|uniref:non-specific serine/threonine protein kinase n=1 Tax=Entomortierella chlamydospora TaxID=101097 RepID=A0A9P6MUM0_9FUNG|nr:casein kinase I [Entomortierella chlamydospora]